MTLAEDDPVADPLSNVLSGASPPRPPFQPAPQAAQAMNQNIRQNISQGASQLPSFQDFVNQFHAGGGTPSILGMMRGGNMQPWNGGAAPVNALMPGHHPGMRGGPIATPGGGGTGAPIQGNPVTQFPLNPYQAPQMPGMQPGMVGSSYGVQGMQQATNPYGLPTY